MAGRRYGGRVSLFASRRYSRSSAALPVIGLPLAFLIGTPVMRQRTPG